jgi:RNA polymerase sigma-70 factor, ECF subfamily
MEAPQPPRPQTDHLATRSSLLNRIKDPEDALSWSEFFERYRRVVLGIARSRGLSEANAEEVALEVFTKVARNIRNFETGGRPGSFRSWLYRLTRWRAQDKALSEGRHTQQSENIEDHDQSLSQPDPINEALEKEARGHIIDVLFHRLENKVPTRQLQIFRMLVIDEVPVDKVCALFRISTSNAYVIRHRILAKLREEAALMPLDQERT